MVRPMQQQLNVGTGHALPGQEGIQDAIDTNEPPFTLAMVLYAHVPAKRR